MAIKINVNFKTEDKGQVSQPVLKPVNPLWNKNVTPSPVVPRLNVPTSAPVVPRLQLPQSTTNRIQTMKESSLEPQKPTLRIPFNYKDSQQGSRGTLTAEAQRIALEQTPAPIAGTLGGIGSAFGIKNTPEQEQYLRDTKKGYGAYSVAGNIIGQVGGYGAVNAALKGTKLGATLVSTLGKKLGDKAGGYVASQGAQLLADAIVQAPMETVEAIQNDKSIGEDVRQILTNRAIDLAMNMAIQGGSDAFKKMMANKKVMQAVVDAGIPESEVIRAIETNDTQAIRYIQNRVKIKGKEYEVKLGEGQGSIQTAIKTPSLKVVEGQKVVRPEPRPIEPEKFKGKMYDEYASIADKDEREIAEMLGIKPTSKEYEDYSKKAKEFDSWLEKSIERQEKRNKYVYEQRGGSYMKEPTPSTQSTYKGFSTKTTGTGYDDFLDKAKLEYKKTNKGQTAYVAEMSPSEYNERVAKQVFKLPKEKSMSALRKNKVAKYINDINNGDEFPMPIIDYRKGSTTQEGRHRALAAELSGIDKIPVLIVEDIAQPMSKLYAQQPIPVVDTPIKRTLTKVPTTTKRLELPKLQKANMDQAKPEYALAKDKVTPELKPVEPIDTRSKVMIEPQGKVKGLIRDKTERTYQELVSKNVPFEKMGGQPKVLAANANRAQGTVEYNLSNKQTDMSGSELGKSADELFKGFEGEKKKDFYDYVLNKHNIQRFEQGKPVFGDTVDSATSSAKAKAYEQANPEFAQSQQEITKYFENLKQDWGVKSGLISKETADKLTEMYPNYVPTYRAMDIPKGMSDYGQNVSKFLKTAKGSERFILPIDEQMKMITARTIKNARKNELMNAVYDAYKLDDAKVSYYVKDVKPLPKEEVTDVLDIGKSMDEPPKINGDNYVVNFYKDGEPMQMTVNKTLYKALETANSDDIVRQVAKFIRTYATNPFKNVVTGYNPLFTASNIMRDVPTALVYSSNPVGMAKSVPDATKQMLEKSAEWKRFQALGGTKSGIVGSEKKLSNTVKGLPVIKQVGNMNDFVEALPRFSEYLNVLKETGNPALAMYRAAELTTDFSRHGNLTKLVDSVVPYLNPSVQGIDRFARNIVKNPLKTATRAGLAITVPSIILDQLNKDNKDYQELSPREKNLYFQIPIPNSDKFVRVPKSRELGVLFSSLYDWAARASRGEKVTGEEIAMAIKENFTPVDIASSAIWTAGQKAFNQIKDPEAYETNYWGSLIVPESQRQYSPGQQYDMNSSGIAKAIGKQFNVSPFVIDYVLSSYGGIIGQGIQPIGADKKTSPLTPILKKFVTDPVMKSDNVNQFYSLLDKKTKDASDYNKINDIDSKIVTPLEKEKNALMKVSKELSDYRKEQRALQVSDDPRRDELVRALQKKMNELARKAVEDAK